VRASLPVSRRLEGKTMKNNGSYAVKGLPWGGSAVLFLLALVKLAVHLGTNLFGGYGIFRDEFYYIACSNHLAFGNGADYYPEVFRFDAGDEPFKPVSFLYGFDPG